MGYIVGFLLFILIGFMFYFGAKINSTMSALGKHNITIKTKKLSSRTIDLEDVKLKLSQEEDEIVKRKLQDLIAYKTKEVRCIYAMVSIIFLRFALGFISTFFGS